ncbi:MAG: K(+)-transporting ATPase subunit F [Polyangiaceae bacterium]
MNTLYWVGAIVSALLFVYLVVAMLEPESLQ